jgi:hypothetical protein
MSHAVTALSPWRVHKPPYHPEQAIKDVVSPLARAPSSAAAIAATSPSSPLRLLPEPSNPPSPSCWTPWSSHRSTLPSSIPSLAGIRHPAAAPPRANGRAAATHQRPLRPSHHHQSNHSEIYRTPMLLVHLLRPPFTAGELAPPPEGTGVRVFVPEGLSVRIKGICVNLEKLPGTPLKIYSTFFQPFWPDLVNFVEIHRKDRKMQNKFCWVPCE